MSLPTFLAVIAQLTTESPALYTYGPLGIMCAFFMWRDVARDKERAVFIDEIRGLSHRIDGLTRQLMMEMIERGAAGEAMMDYIRDQIAKIDARSPRQ